MCVCANIYSLHFRVHSATGESLVGWNAPCRASGSSPCTIRSKILRWFVRLSSLLCFLMENKGKKLVFFDFRALWFYLIKWCQACFGIILFYSVYKLLILLLFSLNFNFMELHKWNNPTDDIWRWFFQNFMKSHRVYFVNRFL